MILSLILLGVLALLALIPANIAQNKGYSFGGYWLFGVCFFLPALIVALVIQDKRLVTVPTQMAQQQNADRSNPAQIQELKILYDSGVLTFQEYCSKKNEVLRRKERKASVSEDAAYHALAYLKAMLDEGILSSREYELKKAEIMGYEAEEDREIREATAMAEEDRAWRFRQADQIAAQEAARSRVEILRKLRRA